LNGGGQLRWAALVGGIFVASLLIRLAAVWFVPETHLGTNAEIAFLRGAHLLVEGKGFRDPAYPVFTPPLYACVIAGSLYLFHDDQMPVRIAQAVADALTVVVIYLIALQIFGPPTALLSGLALGVYPFSIYAVTYIGPETFFTLLLSIFVLLSIYAIRCGCLRYYLGAGFILGITTLMRGTTQYYPIVFLLLLLALRGMPRFSLPKYVAFVGAFAMVIFPWSFRNYVVLGDVIPVATASSVFLQGSAERFMSSEGKRREYPGYFALLKSRGLEPPQKATPAQDDRFHLRAGIESYRIQFERSPLSVGVFFLKKFGRLWYGSESERNHLRILLLNIPIYVSAAIGVGLTWRRRLTTSWVIHALLLYFILLHWLTFPLFRYMLPVMPYVIVLGAFVVGALLGYRDGHKRGDERSIDLAPTTGR
jgi:4-amino-4-deoxy-L-arabinose transferase-like glycosyltransferase